MDRVVVEMEAEYHHVSMRVAVAERVLKTVDAVGAAVKRRHGIAGTESPTRRASRPPTPL